MRHGWRLPFAPPPRLDRTRNSPEKGWTIAWEVCNYTCTWTTGHHPSLQINSSAGIFDTIHSERHALASRSRAMYQCETRLTFAYKYSFPVSPICRTLRSSYQSIVSFIFDDHIYKQVSRIRLMPFFRSSAQDVPVIWPLYFVLIGQIESKREPPSYLGWV